MERQNIKERMSWYHKEISEYLETAASLCKEIDKVFLDRKNFTVYNHINNTHTEIQKALKEIKMALDKTED